MAIDTFGLTGVDTLQINGYTGGKAPASITLSPVNNPNEFQFIGNVGLDYSFGQNTKELGAEAWTIGGVTVFARSGFQFDQDRDMVRIVSLFHFRHFINAKDS